jgi:hypothetical protein
MTGLLMMQSSLRRKRPTEHSSVIWDQLYLGFELSALHMASHEPMSVSLSSGDCARSDEVRPACS